MADMGRQAVEMLLALSGTQHAQTELVTDLVVQGSLVVRGSSSQPG
jgi:DNA-binding LacI/PurR family transcriptional regulator